MTANAFNNSNQNTLTSTQSSLHSKIDEVISHFNSLESSSPKQSMSHPPPHINLDAPCFDGADAMSWIFKISQFFYYHGTPNDEGL